MPERCYLSSIYRPNQLCTQVNFQGESCDPDEPQNLPQRHRGRQRARRGRLRRAAHPDPGTGRRLAGALKGLYGTSAAADSKAITIKAPIQAENGAVVPIAVSTSLPGVESIAIFVQANERPLIASVALSGAEGYFSARMKMGKTSDVKVVVKSGGKLHTASQQIKVTVGGCGG